LALRWKFQKMPPLWIACWDFVVERPEVRGLTIRGLEHSLTSMK